MVASAKVGATQYFDDVADQYAAWYEAPTAAGHALRERQRRVLELIDPPCGPVLDVGCGPGILAGELLRRGYDVWGVDGAPGMIEQCRRRFGEVATSRFFVADATRLAFPDGFFRAVICTGVVDRLPDQEAAIREMARVVQCGGTLLISFPNRLSPYAGWKNYLYYPTLAGLRRVIRRWLSPALPSSLARLHTVGSAAAMLTRQHLAVEAVAHYYFNPFPSPLDEWFPRAARRLVSDLERLRHSPFRWTGAGFIVQGRKRS